MSTTEQAVKETPILMCGDMVRATLDDRKTNTRRLRGLEPVNENPAAWAFDGFTDGDSSIAMFHSLDRQHALQLRCPYGWSGDRLWVREAFDIVDDPAAHDPNDGPEPELPNGYRYDCPPCVKRGPNGERWVVDYRANTNTRMIDKAGARRWRASIHMPRWASRITLELTDVRVERVQKMSESDCEAEGIVEIERSLYRHGRLNGYGMTDTLPEDASTTRRNAFAQLWDKINGKGAWARNEWVWVLSFKRLEQSRA